MVCILARSRMRRIVPAAVLVFSLTSPADPTLAGQTSEASIIGQVTDESGAVLPGVTVTATSPALQVPQMVSVTNASGEYRVTPLPPGTYTVEYALPGFRALRRENLRLTAGFVAKVDVVLNLGAVTESITVSGQSPVVDVRTTTARTQLTKEILENIPTGRNGLQNLMTMAPGARTNLDFGQFRNSEPIFRAFGRDNNAWVLIDGVATTTPYGGSNGGSNVVNYGSIEEASVQTVGSSAESPSSGIQLSVITKSGGNDFHGGASFSQSGPRLQANNVDDTLRGQGITNLTVVERWDRSGELGGPIVRNKLWFYFSARMRKDVSPILGLFQPDGSEGLGGTKQDFTGGKLSYQLSPAHKFIGSYLREHRLDDASNASRFTDWDTRGLHPRWVKTGKVEWQIAKGNKFASLQVGSWASPSGPHTGFTDKPSTIDQVTSRVTGVDPDAGVHNDYGRYDSRGTMSWYKPELFLGNHDFKTGFNYGVARGNVATNDRGAAGNYTLIFRNAVPFQISARNNPVTPKSALAYLGTFVQDSWTISRRLTLNLGIRYAHDRGSLPEQCRDAAPPPFENLYPAQCFPAVQFKIWNPVTPRLHAAYDLTGDGKTVIKGGWGLFATMRGAEDLLLAAQNVDLSTLFRWTDRNGDKLFQPGEANLDVNGPDFNSRQLTVASSLVGLVENPDLLEQGSHELSLQFEREVMQNFALRLSGIYSGNFNTMRVVNQLRPYSAYNIPITNADPGPDGRLGTADDPGTTITYYDFPASLAGLKFQQPTFVNDANADANYKSFEIAATKRLSGRWQLMASYSATKSHVPFVPDITGSRAVSVTSLNPNAEIFAANDTWEWATRINGSYLFPADIQVSANFLSQSGEPWARTVSFAGGQQITSITLRVEPIGTRRLPTLNLLTLRAEKGFRLKAGHRLALRAQAFNVLNTNVIAPGATGSTLGLTLNQQSGASFMRPTAIAPARIGEIALTYSF